MNPRHPSDDAEDDMFGRMLAEAIKDLDPIDGQSLNHLTSPEAVDLACDDIISGRTLTPVDNDVKVERDRSYFWVAAAAVAALLLASIPFLQGNDDAATDTTPSDRRPRTALEVNVPPGDNEGDLESDDAELLDRLEVVEEGEESGSVEVDTADADPDPDPEAETDDQDTDSPPDPNIDPAPDPEPPPSTSTSTSTTEAPQDEACFGSGDTVEEAREDFAANCPGRERFDCDPTYPGWLCSDQQVGDYPPPGE